MNKGTAMDALGRVRLTDVELIERGQNMAAKLLHVGALRQKKKDDAKNTQALIDTELDEAERLARVITEAEESRKQGDLFVTDKVATEALAEVARRACTDVDALSCPVHGPCSCEQELRLTCSSDPDEAAACIGTEEGAEPGCNLCCDHEGGMCRPVVEADRPKPTTAPAVKSPACALHGVDSEHAKMRAEEPVPAADGPVPAEEEEVGDDDEDQAEGEPV